MVAGQLGDGQVVWSGLNLSYHYNQYFSPAEGQLIRNILESMIEIKDEGTLVFEVNRPKPEKVVVKGNDFRGVIIKENNYGGWTAKMVSPYQKRLKVYNAGLGYVYAQLPTDVNARAEVEFNYRGTGFNWFFFLLAVIFSVIIVFKIIFTSSQSTVSRKFDPTVAARSKFNRVMKGWWDKGDQEDY